MKICRLREENGFLPDLAELESLVDGKTKLICINNPNNPTGALMDGALLRGVAKIAAGCGAWVLCDEAYRGLNHAQYGENFAPPISRFVRKGRQRGLVFQDVFAGLGLRLGWVAAACGAD